MSVKPNLECLEDRIVLAVSTNPITLVSQGYQSGQKMLAALPNNTGVHLTADVLIITAAEDGILEMTSAATAAGGANPQAAQWIALRVDAILLGFAFAAVTDAYNGGHTGGGSGSASTTTTSPPSSSPSSLGQFAGSYQGTNLTPTNVVGNEPGIGQVTLTLNADGSGKLSIPYFDGIFGFSVSFPAGTGTFDPSTNTFSFNESQYQSGPFAIGVSNIHFTAPGGRLQATGDIFAVDTSNDNAVYFQPTNNPLYKQ
jgi:hypothetical protein